MEEKKQITIKLRTIIMILILGIIVIGCIIVFGCKEYKGDYQKSIYYDVHMNDNIGNIIEGEYEIVTNYEDYENIIEIIKDFIHYDNVRKEFNSEFFEEKYLLVIDCCGVGRPNFYSELQKVEEKNDSVKIEIYIESSGVTADAIGNVYFIPISKNIISADIEYKRPIVNIDFPISADKPIIYLYPTEETLVSVKLGNPEKITCSYPEYIDGWDVIAKPDGTLIYTETGRELYSLYWEGKDVNAKVNTKEGFVIKGEDTVSFLEEKLEILGLNSKEAEEFIIYWLPKMQNNEYNYIRFASMEEIEEYMPLEVNPAPDTVIRILMEFKGLDEYIEVKEQKLEKAERSGFTVVEWGGTEIK